jgi:hypothetical protein
VSGQPLGTPSVFGDRMAADVLQLAVIHHHQRAAQSALGDTQPPDAGSDRELARGRQLFIQVPHRFDLKNSPVFTVTVAGPSTLSLARIELSSPLSLFARSQ